MNIKKKIEDAIYRIILLEEQLAHLKARADVLNVDLNFANGSLNTLSELYTEETGDDLQKLVNTDPKYLEMIQVMKKRAALEVAQSEGLSKQSENEPDKTPPEIPQLEVMEAPQVEENQTKPVTRNLDECIVDDNPPRQGDDVDE